MQARRPPDRSVQAARELLGVAADAGRPQLIRAYRRQARRLHPDISLEPHATERFWALQAAYQLALDAAPPNEPPAVAASPAAARGPATGAAHRDPTVVLHTTPARAVSPSTGPGPRHVAWLVAGPVRVRPSHGPVPGVASTKLGGTS